jgi:mannan endo-1,6-alpha-mannosidase
MMTMYPGNKTNGIPGLFGDPYYWYIFSTEGDSLTFVTNTKSEGGKQAQPSVLVFRICFLTMLTVAKALIDYWYYTGDEGYLPVTMQAMMHQVGPDRDYLPPNQSVSMVDTLFHLHTSK